LSKSLAFIRFHLRRAGSPRRDQPGGHSAIGDHRRPASALDLSDHDEPRLNGASCLDFNERFVEPECLRLDEVDAVLESVEAALALVELELRRLTPFILQKLSLF
jgi:hypothetical protein